VARAARPARRLIAPSAAGPTVAIVGGGASGTLTAVHLLRSAAPVRVVLIERGDRTARGVAYSTPFPQHLLNVPAASMSGLAAEPGHLLRWLAARGDEPTDPLAFVPRATYGDYLSALLRESVEASQWPFEHRRAEAVGLSHEGGRSRLALSDGGHVDADRVVLAIGNLPPRSAPLRSGHWPADPSRYVPDPWSPGALDRVAAGDALLVGTGLTMIDVALRILAERPASRLTAVSRSGLVPQAHRQPGQTHRTDFRPPPPGTPLRELAAAVRAAVAEAERAGGDWRDVVNALRPHTQALWQGMDAGDQRRFAARFARFWDIHRHRMAPEVAARVAGFRRSGRLTILAGRLESVESDAGGLTITAVRRGTGAISTWRVAYAVNCTGPGVSVIGAGSRLLDDLCAQGLARPHPLGLGLDTGGPGALREASGRLSSTLFTIGWMRRGELWESVAIPEIRAQAAALAQAAVRPV
jgi:uncharacterized NAD(P)/FAD-binding protein YdhS